MRILPVFIPHAGCQHDCVFCNQFSTSHSPSVPSPEEVVDLVSTALSDGSLDEIAFYGGSFTALPHASQRAYLEPIQPYLQSGAVAGVRLSTRPDAINKDVLDLLDNFGVTTVELGCQSFSDEVLRASGRGHTAEDTLVAVQLLRQYGFDVGLQLMPGLPSFDTDEIYSSVRIALDLAPDFMRIYPVVVLAGTTLAKMLHLGQYQPLPLDEAVEICADIDQMCRLAGVPVIRFGLQASEGLNRQSILAGPYHPAFGQLVKSRLWRRALKLVSRKVEAKIQVHPADFSDAVGHRRSNLHFLADERAELEITSSALVQRGFIRTEAGLYPMNSLLAAGEG